MQIEIVPGAKKVYAICAWIFCWLSSPPEFSGGVPEKYFCPGWVRTFNLQITNQILYQCAKVSLCKKLLWHPFCNLLGFSAVSVVTRGDFLAISVITVQDFPAVCVVTCRNFSAITFPAWGNVKSLPPGTRWDDRDYWPGFSGPNFSGMRDWNTNL
jgi:hypothetical protein